MPNDILTRAIDEICAGTHLTADHTSAALAEIMEGRASEVQTAAFLVSLRAKGETVSELVGLARTMRQLAAHVEIDKPGLVDTAGHRRRADHLQHLDHRSPDRGRGGLPGREAREPLRDQPLGIGGRARGARRRHRALPGRGGHLHRGDRLRLHVRAQAPRGDGSRDPGSQGARRAHDLQLPGPADEPGRRRRSPARRLRSQLPGDHRGRPAAARLRAGAGRLRRRRHR